MGIIKSTTGKISKKAIMMIIFSLIGLAFLIQLMFWTDSHFIVKMVDKKVPASVINTTIGLFTTSVFAPMVGYIWAKIKGAE